MSKKGSLIHQIVSKCTGLRLGASTASKNSLVQYKNAAIKFGQWCVQHRGCHSYDDIADDIVNHLNAYSKWLQAEGKSAATIHTYIAGCCVAWQVPMEEIKKPIRHCYENTRSRGEKAVDRRKDAKREASPRLYDFAQFVLVRRHEYLALRQSDFVKDESGYDCVLVRKGKGGKRQLQRILPENVEFMQNYFNGSEEFVFTKDEMNNKIDLHAIRGIGARREYEYYLNRLRTEPGYRAQLEKEIGARWELYRGALPKKSQKTHEWEWDVSKVRGTYYLRGKNRQCAAEKGLAVAYDRCAVMAVSVFHLSHWRCDVTIDNYLLAV